MKKLVMAAIVGATLCAAAEKYEANWKSLDSRPVPQWWTDAKFGVFIHWGPYAVPAFAPTPKAGHFDFAYYSEWYQGFLRQGKSAFVNHHKQQYRNAPYGNFAARFTAENFDAAAWAKLFKDAGAKYVVLTSKHHDGFALWPSPESPYYNAVALGSGRDLAREFVDAMAAAGLKRGFYYSMLEYANPLYPAKRDGTTGPAALKIGEWNRRVNIPQLKELATDYKADIIWTDGEWDYTSDEHGSKEFLAWLYNESPVKDTVVANDRWGSDCRGKHGGHYTTEYAMEGGDQSGRSNVHPWEECRGIGNSFGYNRFETPANYMSREKCLETLVRCVSAGGNLLLNVGPTADGLIPAIMQDRLLAMGAWLKVNGEAIYATTRGDLQTDAKRVYFTRKGNVRYAIDFRGDGTPFAVKGAPKNAKVALVGSTAAVETRAENDALVIVPPTFAPAAAPCEHAWVYRIEVRGTVVPSASNAMFL